jgi:hypothetical protein
MRSALPLWLRLSWLFPAPVGLLFVARIAWEKMVWTWTRGPQAIGFSLMHVHPFFSIAGILCSCMLMLWLIPALCYVIFRWRMCSKTDIAMVLLCLLVMVAIVLPDTFFAHLK